MKVLEFGPGGRLVERQDAQETLPERRTYIEEGEILKWVGSGAWQVVRGLLWVLCGIAFLIGWCLTATGNGTRAGRRIW